MHIEIQHVKGKGFHLLGKDQYFPGLKELVEHYIFQGLLKGAEFISFSILVLDSIWFESS